MSQYRPGEKSFSFLPSWARTLYSFSTKVSRTFVLLNKTSLIVLPWISAENGSITCLSDDLVLAEEKLFNYFKELIQHRRPPPLNKEALRIRKSALQSYLKENYFENESQEETIVIAVKLLKSYDVFLPKLNWSSDIIGWLGVYRPALLSFGMPVSSASCIEKIDRSR